MFRSAEVLDAQDSLEAVLEDCSLTAATPPEGYTIQIAATVAEIEALRPAWSKLAHSLDTDIDYYLHELSQNPLSREAYAISVSSGGKTLAILAGQIRKKRASTVISFVNIPGPTERVLEIKKGGRMGPESQVIDRLLAWELLKAARSVRIDSLSFERLPLNSGLFRELRQLPGFFVKERVPHTFFYSMLSLSPADESKPRPLFSGKIAREIRRKERILNRAFPEQVELKCYSRADELDLAIADAMRIAATTWQRYLGVGLSDSIRARETLDFFARQGWLRVFVLYLGGVPCAFLIGQLYGDTFCCQYAGYDPKYAKLSVGFILTARAFTFLASSGVKRADLGEGGQEHNRRLGCEMREEATVHVYSPTLRGVCLNVFFGTAQLVRTGGRRTQSALNLHHLSKVWRHYLLKKWHSRGYSSRSRLQPSNKIGRKHV